ncbi:hypothetical protein GT037_010139 [Alternaria burnsii]|uniref:Uncharacterized protein n=1 Tax=Alternaria burnsii TaxID=1187904 RepID=A0A8H7EDI2_9PLEO|nr:uncharacterized protein GT037_010139 [Alternaria burnsii]KAF7671916.1 hypothetical protein GT037_010139 [Alternaria burnsii]
MDHNTERRDSAMVADDPNQHLVFPQRNSISESCSSDDSEISHSRSLPSLKRPYSASRSDGLPDVLRTDKFALTQHSGFHRDHHKPEPVTQTEKEKGTKTVNSMMAATKKNNVPLCKYGSRRKLNHRNDDVKNRVCWFHGSRHGEDKKGKRCQN